MHHQFHKYQATANDFILIDNREGKLPQEDKKRYARWCHRRLGVGADGLLFIEKPQSNDAAFYMRYFNSDGKQSTFCGNGSRCALHFARKLGISGDETVFESVVGKHRGKLTGSGARVEMHCDDKAEQLDDDTWFIDSGSPHVVKIVEQSVADLDVVRLGRSIRNSERFRKAGVNVNFVRPGVEGLEMRTYERGVEDETWSCGTGVTAAGLVWLLHYDGNNNTEVNLATPGGALNVYRRPEGVFLEGPLEHVFTGQID